MRLPGCSLANTQPTASSLQTRPLCRREPLLYTRRPALSGHINSPTLLLSQQTHARVETQAFFPSGSAPYHTPAATTTRPRRTLPSLWLRQYRSWTPLSRPSTAVTESRCAIHTIRSSSDQADHCINSKNKPRLLSIRCVASSYSLNDLFPANSLCSSRKTPMHGSWSTRFSKTLNILKPSVRHPRTSLPTSSYIY